MDLFSSVAKEKNDYFMKAIILNTLGERVKIFEEFFLQAADENPNFLSSDWKPQEDFGFDFKTYSPNFFQIFQHCQNSPNWKVYWNQAMENQHPDFDPYRSLTEKDFLYFTVTDRVHMSLFTLILLKKRKPEKFAQLLVSHQDAIL